MIFNNNIDICFDAPKPFEANNIKPIGGITGVYFIFSSTIQIQYPFDKSRLLYIGMSEKRSNRIGDWLSGHFDGKSKNVGLTNYRKTEPS